MAIDEQNLRKYFQQETIASLSRMPSMLGELVELGIASAKEVEPFITELGSIEAAITADEERFSNAPDPKLVNIDPSISDRGALLHLRFKSYLLSLYDCSGEARRPLEQQFVKFCDGIVEALSNVWLASQAAAVPADRLIQLNNLYLEVAARWPNDLKTQFGFHLALPWLRSPEVPGGSADAIARFLFSRYLDRAEKMAVAGVSPAALPSQFKSWR